MKITTLIRNELKIPKQDILGVGSFAIVYQDPCFADKVIKATVDESICIQEGITIPDEAAVTIPRLEYLGNDNYITYNGKEYVIYLYRMDKLNKIKRISDLSRKNQKTYRLLKSILYGFTANYAPARRLKYLNWVKSDLNKIEQETKHLLTDFILSTLNSNSYVDGFNKANIMIDDNEQLYIVDPLYDTTLMHEINKVRFYNV